VGISAGDIFIDENRSYISKQIEKLKSVTIYESEIGWFPDSLRNELVTPVEPESMMKCLPKQKAKKKPHLDTQYNVSRSYPCPLITFAGIESSICWKQASQHQAHYFMGQLKEQLNKELTWDFLAPGDAHNRADGNNL